MSEVNKKQVCFGVLEAHLQVAENGEKSFTLPRKDLLNLMYDALIEAGIDKHDIKPNLCTSYYQMGRMEYIKGTGAYAHHKYKSKKKEGDETTSEEQKEPEVVIPEGSQWMAQMDDTIEYFKNRQAARDFAKDQDGEWKVSKIAQ
jgi:hypothetical protein